MGWFGERIRSVGRTIGRGVERFGQVTGIKSIENAGRKIQDICQETSRRTGSSREYDQDTATVDETAHIAEILSSFSSGLREDGHRIEQTARKNVEDYFDQLYEAMDMTLGRKKAVKSLMLQKQIVLGSISGSFNEVLTRRVSLSDAECLAILKLPKGAAKEAKMKKFGEKVINEGLEKLCNNVKKSVEVIRKETESELNDILQEQQRLLEEFALQIEEVARKRQDDMESQETSLLFPSQKLAASELLLDLVQGGSTI